jgi:hypothetical protein
MDNRDGFVPAQVGYKTCGVLETLFAYKLLVALESGELDGRLDTVFTISLAGKKTTVEDFDKSARRWLEDGVRNGKLNANHDPLPKGSKSAKDQRLNEPPERNRSGFENTLDMRES